MLDDHQMFAEALEVLLSADADIRVVGRTATDDPELPRLLARLRPDVVTVDVEPFGARTVEALTRIGAALPGVHIVVLTGSDDVTQVVDAARAGAVAWLSKESPSGELAGTVRAVCEGDACYPPAHLRAVLRAMSADAAGAATRRDPLSVLTQQERRVLAGLVEGASSAELAAGLQVAVGTVRAHTHNIFAKLGVHTKLEAVRFARAAGMQPRRSWNDGIRGAEGVPKG